MFYLIELILYVTFLTIDLNILKLKIDSSNLKYLSVVIIFLYLIFQYKQGNLKKLTYLVSLVCIVIADFFLLFTNNYLLGIGLFCIVQLCYCYLIRDIYQVVKLFCSVLILCVLTIIFIDELLVVACLFYSICSIYNLYHSLKNYRKSRLKKDGYLFLGILLLALCDFHILLSFLLYNSNIWITTAIWLFYLPSQLSILRAGLLDE